MDLYSDGSEDDMDLNGQTENAAPARVPAQSSRAAAANRKGLMSTTLKKQGASGRGAGDAVLGPAKTAKGKATRVTKAPAAKKKTSREVLGERRSPNGSWEEDDDGDELGSVQPEADALAKPLKGARRGKKDVAHERDNEVEAAPLKSSRDTKATKKGRGKAKAVEEDDEQEEAPAALKKTVKGRAKQTNASTRPASPPQQVVVADSEAEPDPMEVELSIEMDDFPEPEPLPVKTSSRPAARQLAQPPSSRQHSVMNSHRIGGSASDTERGITGADVRRRLGETTKELEKLRLRYDDLRSIGVQDRESNFDRLKKTTDQREKGILRTIHPAAGVDV
jgi:hypothetical protein